MKKQLAGILTAAVIFSFGATSAFAAGRGCHYQNANHNGGCNFTGTTCAYADEDGDGICDYCGMSSSDDNWHGVHYVDANNDGVCDYYAAGTCPHNGTGYGHGYYGGHGRHCRQDAGFKANMYSWGIAMSDFAKWFLPDVHKLTRWT